MNYDVIIIGAGAAGLFCASQLGQRGKRVLVLEHAEKIGKKILISGGGRCNFTNLDCTPNKFLSQNPHFVKSALSRFDQHDFIQMVNDHKIAYHEKTLGQLFCDNSAKEIVEMLSVECAKGDVEIQTVVEIKSLEHRGDTYVVNGSNIGKNLVIATGGPAIPKMGATGFAYDVAKKFNIPVITPTPALVPLTLSDHEKIFKGLSGIATPSITSNNRASFNEATLFTHKGLSGPAILQISSYWREGESIHINLTPNQPQNWLRALKQSQSKWHLKRALNTVFPERLASALSEEIKLTSSLAETRDDALEAIETNLANWQFTPNGSEGFAKAEVTLGGIDTNALNSKSMAVKALPSLYFIGESVDVTGWLGGYNFQWAWSSGHACAVDIAAQN